MDGTVKVLGGDPIELKGDELKAFRRRSAMVFQDPSSSLNPEFIVMDEAVSALDVSIQAQILNLFLDLKDQPNLPHNRPEHSRH